MLCLFWLKEPLIKIYKSFCFCNFHWTWITFGSFENVCLWPESLAKPVLRHAFGCWAPCSTNMNHDTIQHKHISVIHLWNIIHLSRHLSSIYHNTDLLSWMHHKYQGLICDTWSIYHHICLQSILDRCTFSPLIQKKRSTFWHVSTLNFSPTYCKFHKKYWDITMIYPGVCFSSETWREQEVWDV